jgi:hypothetical protein
MRDAMLRDGGITVAGIEVFTSEFARAFNAALGVDDFAQMDLWDDAAGAAKAVVNSAPALIENPRVVRIARLPDPGMPEPLQQFVVTNHGSSTVLLSLLLTGTADGREAAPLLANVTTGDALVFMGDVPEGKRLWIHGTESGATALLETEDVTANLRSVSGLVPGTQLTKDQLVWPPKPLPLVVGANQLWFFPIALFNVPGLDRFHFSMPDLTVQDGRFGSTRFDHAFFYQPPVMTLHAGWIEETPASFEVRLPAAMLGGKALATKAPSLREELASSVAEGVGELRAAGVTASVTMEVLADLQPQRDRLRLVMPVLLSEHGSMGADRRTNNAGSFEVTLFDDSTFR